VQICRVGQYHIYTVYIQRYFWQGNHRIYGHIRCIYTVLADPTDMAAVLRKSHFMWCEGLCYIVSYPTAYD